MKKLSQCFSVLLTAVTLVTLTALPSFAASTDNSNAKYIAGGVIVIAVLLIIVIAATASNKKKNKAMKIMPKPLDVAEPENRDGQAEGATAADTDTQSMTATGSEKTDEGTVAAASVENTETENFPEAEALSSSDQTDMTEEAKTATEEAKTATEEAKTATEEAKTATEEVKTADVSEPSVPEESAQPENPVITAADVGEETAEMSTAPVSSVETAEVSTAPVSSVETTETEKTPTPVKKSGKKETVKEKKSPVTGAEKPTVTQPEFADMVKEITSRDVPKEAIDPETKTVYTFDSKGIPVPPEGMVIRYKWSFLARLSQADPDVKYHYLTLRRTLLAYKKMRSNVSWNYDSYFTGRKTIAKLKIRGKNLVVYFPIDPKTMEGTKYIGEDFSSVSRYKAVPFAYRINGTRKLKYAIELIEQLMGGKPENQPELVPEADVEKALPSGDFDTLYLRELIKIGGFLTLGGANAASDEDDE